ncbi:flavin-dependent oxidoreductase, partial [Micromonospora aurantiaca]|nr:flavin-dependent oxidoreductase [Micromonospora aurantiaca]
GGPENVIDEVERRAPDGFSRLEDVMDPAELEAIVSDYTRISGASKDQVDRPSPATVPEDAP